MDKCSPKLDYKKCDTVLMTREKKLKFQALWYEIPYLIYQAHENNTYDLINKDREFFRLRVNDKNLMLYHDNTEIFARFKVSNCSFSRKLQFEKK